MNERARRILEFWFADSETGADALGRRMAFWFGSEDPAEQRALDTAIATEFAEDLGRAARGELDSWRSDPHERLALLLLLDQFSRNVHRGTAQAFATDAEALALTLDGIRSGVDRELSPVQRLFFYMPMQHAEDLAVQEESVRRFGELARSVPASVAEKFQACLRYAELHRDIVRRFGRFPHRNAVLGRATTPEEREWLAGDAPDFGQTS